MKSFVSALVFAAIFALAASQGQTRKQQFATKLLAELEKKGRKEICKQPASYFPDGLQAIVCNQALTIPQVKTRVTAMIARLSPTTAAPPAKKPAPTKGAAAPVTKAPVQLTGVQRLVADLKKRGEQARTDFCNCKVNCIRLTNSNDKSSSDEKELKGLICNNKAHSVDIVIRHLENPTNEPTATPGPTMGTIPFQSFAAIKGAREAKLTCDVCYKNNVGVGVTEMGCPKTVRFPLRCALSHEVTRM